MEGAACCAPACHGVSHDADSRSPLQPWRRRLAASSVVVLELAFEFSREFVAAGSVSSSRAAVASDFLCAAAVNASSRRVVYF